MKTAVTICLRSRACDPPLASDIPRFHVKNTYVTMSSIIARVALS